MVQAQNTRFFDLHRVHVVQGTYILYVRKKQEPDADTTYRKEIRGLVRAHCTHTRSGKMVAAKVQKRGLDTRTGARYVHKVCGYGNKVRETRYMNCTGTKYWHKQDSGTNYGDVVRQHILRRNMVQEVVLAQGEGNGTCAWYRYKLRAQGNGTEYVWTIRTHGTCTRYVRQSQAIHTGTGHMWSVLGLCRIGTMFPFCQVIGLTLLIISQLNSCHWDRPEVQYHITEAECKALQTEFLYQKEHWCVRFNFNCLRGNVFNGTAHKRRGSYICWVSTRRRPHSCQYPLQFSTWVL